MLRTIVFWALDDVVSTSQIFSQAKSMPALLLTVTATHYVANIAQNFRQLSFWLHKCHFIHSLHRNHLQIHFKRHHSRLRARTLTHKSRHLGIDFTEQTRYDPKCDFCCFEIEIFSFDGFHVFDVCHLKINHAIKIRLLVPVTLQFHHDHQLEQRSLIVRTLKTSLATIKDLRMHISQAMRSYMPILVLRMFRGSLKFLYF